MQRVLVTGGAGFIGSNLARALLQRGYSVRVLDNLSTGRIENLRGIKKEIEFIEGDIRNSSTLQRWMKGVNYVLHEAAIPSVPRSIDNPKHSHGANVNGTFNVLLAARDADVERVVFASSSSIYGNRQHYGTKKLKHKKEAMKPMPLSPYAVNKLIGEEYHKVFSHIYRVPTVCLRYFNVYGPHQNPQSLYAAAIPKFITSILNDQSPPIFGDGRQSRDFTHIENVIQANILAMTSSKVGHGETINVGCGESISLLAVIGHINRVLGKKVKPDFQPGRAGDVRDSLASIEKAQRLLDYRPIMKFASGIEHTIKWYEMNGGQRKKSKTRRPRR